MYEYRSIYGARHVTSMIAESALRFEKFCLVLEPSKLQCQEEGTSRKHDRRTHNGFPRC